MGIRQTVASALATPMIRALDGVLQKSVEDMIAARAPAGRSEVDAARRALDEVKRDLIARRTDLAALQQAIAVAEHHMDDDLDALFEDGAPSASDEFTRTVRLVQAAVGEVSSRVEDLSARAANAIARADQAGQIATTARATAESLADALDER